MGPYFTACHVPIDDKNTLHYACRWSQDFPLKPNRPRVRFEATADMHAYLLAPKPSDFEAQLSSYLSFLELPSSVARTAQEVCGCFRT